MNVVYFKNNRFRGHSREHVSPSQEIHDTVRAPLNLRGTQRDKEADEHDSRRAKTNTETTEENSHREKMLHQENRRTQFVE